MTPNLGQGANTAIENAAALTNRICAMLDSQASSHLSAPDIHLMLSSWATSRKYRTNAICDSSNALTRIEAFATWRHKVVALRVLPYMGDIIAFLATRIVVGSERLEFLPEPKRALAGSVRFKGQNVEEKLSVLEKIKTGVIEYVGPALMSASLYCLA